MLPAGLLFSLRPGFAPRRHPPLHQPAARDGRNRHAVRRPLRDVYPLRSLHPRNQRHQRAVRHQSRQPRRDRRLPRLSAGEQDVGQRRRPVPGRCVGRQGLSLSAARVVHEEASRRLHRVLDGLLDRSGREPGHGLSPQAAHQPARQRVVDLRRGALRLSPRPQRPPADERRGPKGWPADGARLGGNDPPGRPPHALGGPTWPCCSRHT